jgi:phosphopantothenoylcysteine synthetase/decarboxylase
MSNDAQIGGAIAAIYRHNMGMMIERWERHITAAGPNIAPGIKEEELAQFRGRVSNPANVREFMERWAGEEGDVEEGLGEGEKGEGGNDDSDDLEIIISDDDDEDNEDEDEEMADFIVDDVEEDEEID